MNTATHTTDSAPAFEIKGSALTLMVLHLFETDAAAACLQLREKFGKAPGFFKNAPLLIDLNEVQKAGTALDLPRLAATLRELGLVPVGVRGGTAEQESLALSAGLGILPSARSERPAPAPESVPEPAPESNLAQPVPASGSRVITQPIRSGQRVVANGDLIVLSSVNSGAEILATGNIHVYGSLRGRAFAGAQGDTEARVFCLQFNPDLVAIAGEYLVNDELDKAHIGKTTLVSLRDDRLKVEPIGIFDPHE
jgi:septum site-determining protein MinC